LRLFRRLLRQYQPEVLALTRRESMRRAGALGLLLTGGKAAMAVGPQSSAQRSRRVIVVGAGLAGLACGYELQRTGYDVKLLEARGRVGGRVLTLRNWIPGKVVEAGGELIGSNHPMWVHYAALFGLGFRSTEDWPEESGPVLIDGELLGETQKKALFKELDRLLDALTDQSRDVDADKPWLSENAADLDRKISRNGWQPSIRRR
jgi:monoamine oxidase